jgi:hypothetical protein
LTGAPGRGCPLSYRYDATTAFQRAAFDVESLWVAGGLYGNPFALDVLLERFGKERGSKALVFNGDFHWFDVDQEDFQRIDSAVARFVALRGNVETELAAPVEDAGCGCGYPEFVDDETVERSNRIHRRLLGTARNFPRTLQRLAALPMTLAAQVGDERVGVVHGDAESLAGWGFSQERLATADGSAAALAAFDRAGVSVFASSHTCLPVLQGFAGGRLVANNGAAGMPNFRGRSCGLATRISVRPSAEAVLRARTASLYVEAVPLDYDPAAWLRRFLAQWPAGSDAHRSYYERMVHGPGYAPAQALRTAVALAA